MSRTMRRISADNVPESAEQEILRVGIIPRTKGSTYTQIRLQGRVFVLGEEVQFSDFLKRVREVGITAKEFGSEANFPGCKFFKLEEVLQ